MYSRFFNSALAASKTSNDEFSIALNEAEFIRDSLLSTDEQKEALSVNLAILSNIEARLEVSKTQDATNMALVVMDGFSGGEAQAQLGYSMESMGDFQDVTLAGLGGMISAGWEKMIKFLKDLRNKAKAFMSSFFDKMPKLKKQAEKLKEKAGEVEGAPKDKKIKIGNAYKALVTADKKVEKVEDGLKTIVGLPNTLKVNDLANMSEGVSEALSDIDSLVNNGAEVSGWSRGKLDNTIFGASSELSDDEKKQMGSATHYVKGTFVKDLPGNKMFTLAFKASGSSTMTNKDCFDRLNSLSLKSPSQDPKLKPDNDTEVATLSVSEVEAICDQVIAIADAYEKSGRKEIEKGLKEQDKLISLAEKTKGKVDKDEFKKVKSTINSASSATMSVASNMTQPMSTLSVYAYQTAVAALSYASSSLSNHES